MYAPGFQMIALMQTPISKILSALMTEPRKIKQSEIAEATGVKQSTISRILNPGGPKGIREPTDRQVKPLADFFNLTTGQLRGYEPLPERVIAPVRANPQINEGGVVYGDFPANRRKGDINIPQYDVRASMGDGQVLPSDYIDTVRRITVSAEFLLEQGVSYTKPANLAVITGFGESMNKTFSNGDPLIIDQGVNSVVTDGVYLFTLAGSLFVKRLQLLPNGLRVISDSDAFPPFDVTGDDVSTLIVHARVLLAWRSQRL